MGKASLTDAGDHAIRGVGYGLALTTFDGAAGAFSRVSLGASELGPYPGRMAHSMAADGGVAFRVVVKRKIAGNELVGH